MNTLVFVRLTCAKGLDDVHLGCPESRQHPSHKTHYQREEKGLPGDVKGQGEAKGKFREGLEIDRRDGDQLHGGSKEETEATTDQTEQE